MMKQRNRNATPVAVDVGFAAAPSGIGIAYLASRSRRASQGAGAVAAPIRLLFRCVPLSGLHGRDVAYAAVAAAAAYLLERGVGAVEIAVPDETLAIDLRERRTVPPALAIPYVALRCKLNRFARAEVVASDDRALADLTARARAEVVLQPAA